MTDDRVRPADLFADAPYAYTAVVPSGDLVFSAGACPLDLEGRVVGVGDVALQAEAAVANLFRALEAAGAEPGAVVKTTVFVASSDQADLVRAWDVVKAAFEPHDPPSTLVGVAQLGYTDQLVEVEAIAAIRRGGPGGDRGPQAT